MESTAADTHTEILSWQKSLPSAPVYRPTLSEFQDPISYILKIEPQASKFGICKIIPPVPPSPKKTAFSNLNRSFAASHPQKSPLFPTWHQQIGFGPRRPHPALKPVWPSGEFYTLQEFEKKSKQFEKTHFRNSAKTVLPPLEIETLFWKAGVGRPLSVEYASDIPGSGFPPVNAKRLRERGGEAGTVGDTAWNMRVVSRAKGSLLSFMEEEVPGVTLPTVYVRMAFSWFAWQLEEHELYGLNSLHSGAGQTWYGVPADAAVAFEEVVRVHGYGGEVNPLGCSLTGCKEERELLCEKTTVLSPEVLVGAGIPCCRLVQNVGEFVVTFPRAYHSGFSHGFNCGEAVNIATPEWLRIAKEAAIRRASIGYPPMLSHIQLLYALALTLCSRMPVDINSVPRSSRLKDKKRGEGDVMVKEIFVQNVMENNDLLYTLLEKGCSCVLVPMSTSYMHPCLNSKVGPQTKVKPRLSLGLCCTEEATGGLKIFSDGIMRGKNSGVRHSNGFYSVKRNSASVSYERKKLPTVKYSQTGKTNSCVAASGLWEMNTRKEATCRGALLDGGQISCVTCGISSFPCAAIIRPKASAARHLMAADYDSFSDQIVGYGVNGDTNIIEGRSADISHLDSGPVWMEKDGKNSLNCLHVHSTSDQVEVVDQIVEPVSHAISHDISSLDLLAVAYGDPSDSEEEAVQPDTSEYADENELMDFSLASCQDELDHDDTEVEDLSHPPFDYPSGFSGQNSGGTGDINKMLGLAAERRPRALKSSIENYTENPSPTGPLKGSNGNLRKTSRSILRPRVEHLTYVRCKQSNGGYCTSIKTTEDYKRDVAIDDDKLDSTELPMPSDDPSCCFSNGTETERPVEMTKSGTKALSVKSSMISFKETNKRSDKDCSRTHIFCLEHAANVEKRLHPIGGLDMLLLCHPDYPKIEGEARALAEELGINYLWKDITFREANHDDEEIVRLASNDEEAIPRNGDWTVKLGINLPHSSILSKSPLYSKQMPSNSVLYKVFSCRSPVKSTEPKVFRRRHSGRKKIFVVGKWCGKVWMSNQVHPYLAIGDAQDEENIKFHNQGIQQTVTVDADTSPSEQMVLPQGKLSLHTNAVVGKSGKKRKFSFERVSKKPKWAQSIDIFKPAEDLLKNSSSQCGRVLRSRPVKCGKPLLNDKKKGLGQSDSNSKVKIKGSMNMPLRKRLPKQPEIRVKHEKDKQAVKVSSTTERQIRKRKARKVPSSNNVEVKKETAEYRCDMDGCFMCFSIKRDLVLHKRNICPVKGCGKKLFSHKYMVQHQRVHMDDRPLKCPWKGCRMTFKWEWARTEHMRVHTGARPYECGEIGCGQTFRFVSDFSRHKRRTGHSVKKKRLKG